MQNKWLFLLIFAQTLNQNMLSGYTILKTLFVQLHNMGLGGHTDNNTCSYEMNI